MASDPSTITSWTAAQLAVHLTRSLPEELRAPCLERIISYDVTGADVLKMMRDLSTPGSKPLKEHPTFTRIFDKEWEGDGWRQWGHAKMAVRTADQAMTNFLMALLNENASVVVAKAQQRIFEIIDPKFRNYEFDAFYDPEESWCIASGTEARVQAENGGQHVVGFYTAPCGWQRLALEVLDDGSKDFKGAEWLGWHKAYHGTRGAVVNSIVTNGLMQPGTIVNGREIAALHGSAGAKGGKKPIYVSPCLEYRAHHIYTAAHHGDADRDAAKKFEAVDRPADGKDLPSFSEGSTGMTFQDVVAAESTYAQFVFEVRVKPGAYRVQGNTIGSWPMKGEYAGPAPATKFLLYDDCCQSDLLEWLVEDCRHVVCTGVMIRQLPHTLKQQTDFRICALKGLSDWADEEGARRPREWGVPEGYTGPVQWLVNMEPSEGHTLSYDPELTWQPYALDTSAIIEAAYQEYQRFVFIGTPKGAPGPYCIHFGQQWHRDAPHEPEQRRADADKEQAWRRRAIRRVPLQK